MRVIRKVYEETENKRKALLGKLLIARSHLIQSKNRVLKRNMPPLKLGSCILSINKSPLKMYLKEQNNLKVHYKARMMDYLQRTNCNPLNKNFNNSNLEKESPLLIPKEMENSNATKEMLDRMMKRKKLMDKKKLMTLSKSRELEEQRQARCMSTKKENERIKFNAANSGWLIVENAILNAKAKKQKSIERAKSVLKHRYNTKWEKVTEKKRRVDFELHQKVLQAENRIKKTEKRYQELM